MTFFILVFIAVSYYSFSHGDMITFGLCAFGLFLFLMTIFAASDSSNEAKSQETKSGAYAIMCLASLFTLIIAFFANDRNAADSSTVGLIVFIITFAVSHSIEGDKKIKLLPTKADKAKVLSKHTKVSGHNTSTDYYATFELTDGSRKVLEVDVEKYGLIMEGDTGILSYKDGAESLKGFVSFEKEIITKS